MIAELDHAALIRPFLNRDVRARYANVSPGKKQRKKLLARISHQYELTLNWRLAEAIPSTEQTSELIGALLQKNGAGETCYVLCAPEESDGIQMPLADALATLVGSGGPVLLVCIPEVLAYFEPEYERGAGRRFILRSKQTSR